MENNNLKNNQPQNETAEPKTNTNSIYYYKVQYNNPQAFETKQSETNPQISVVGKNTPIQKTMPVFKPQPIVTKPGSTVQVQFNKPAMSEVEKALLERVGTKPTIQNVEQPAPASQDWANRSRQTLKVEFNKPFEPAVKIKQPAQESLTQVISQQPDRVEPVQAITQQTFEQESQIAEPFSKPIKQPAEIVQQPVQPAKSTEPQVQTQIPQQTTRAVNKFSQIVYTPTAASIKQPGTNHNSLPEQSSELLQPAEKVQLQQVAEISEPIVEMVSEIIKTNNQANPQTESTETTEQIQPAILPESVQETQKEQKPKSKAKEVASVLFYISLLLVSVYAIIFNISTIFKIVTNENYIPTFFGYKPIVNYSSSKDYNLQEYDLLLFEKATNQNIKTEDLVLFFKEDNLTIQKVKDIYVSGGVTQIITETEDEKTGYQLTLADLEGRYVKKRKGIGKLMAFMNTDTGITLSMVVPIVAYTSIELLIYLRAKKKKIAHTT